MSRTSAKTIVLTPAQRVWFASLRRLSPRAAKRFRRAAVLRLAATRFASFERCEATQDFVLFGFFRGALGLGAAARRLRDAMAAVGLRVTAVDVCDLFGVKKSVEDEAIDAVDYRGAPRGAETVVFCVNPVEVALLLSKLGEGPFRGRRLVGYWWWELDRIPDSWRPMADVMDELWCPSRFIFDGFAGAALRTSVRYVPVCMETPRRSSRMLADFALPSGRFTALAVFDLNSFASRKNPQGALRAFRRAFGDAEDVLLVLKVSGHAKNPRDWDALRREIAAYGNVVAIAETLSAEDLAALIAECDVVLSLHRSEGFGMVPAEAMLLGTTSIVTAWSGILEFADAATSALVGYRLQSVGPADYLDPPAGARWAEPNEAEAADWLARMKNDSGLREAYARVGLERARQRFSAETFARAFGGSMRTRGRGA